MTKDTSDLRQLIEAGFAQMFTRLERIDFQLAQQGERIARMEGRLDEQSRILAAMIPTTLAAVPPVRTAAG